MHMSDTIIYFRKHMGKDQRNMIEANLRMIDGVIAPRFVPNREKLLVVAYNPEKVQAKRFKELLTHMGLEPVIVGM